MPTADVYSSLILIAPVFAYLLVALVVGAVLWKTKILGESKPIMWLVALIVAALFVSFAGAKDFVITLIPWVAVLIVSFVFLVLLIGVVGTKTEGMHKGLGIAFLVMFGIAFLVSAYLVFSGVIVRYLPGPFFGVGADPETMFFFAWLYSPRVFGAILLIIASVVAAFVLTKAK